MTGAERRAVLDRVQRTRQAAHRVADLLPVEHQGAVTDVCTLWEDLILDVLDGNCETL